MATSKFALLESRVATLEAEVSELKQQQFPGSQNGDWIDKIYGLFDDYPDFDQVIELGRQYRESLRPKKPRPSKTWTNQEVKKRKTEKPVKRRKH